MGIKNKLKEKKVTVGSWITFAHPGIAEIMADAGFDWLAIDLEHSVITIREAEELIRVISLAGKTPLVRLTSNNPDQVKRVMDAGSHGVIVPMVNTMDDAIKAIESVKYPPIGKRGVGLARAQGYGHRFKEYKEWLQEESIIIVQIEHIDAVKNLDEILSLEGIDGFIVGPYDLSGSLGCPGDFTHPKVVEALKEIMEVSSKYNVSPGFHVVQPDAESFKLRVDEGFKFIALGIDMLYLGVKCKEELIVAKKYLSSMKSDAGKARK